MDVPQDLGTRFTVWVQHKSPATGAMIISIFFYLRYELTRKRTLWSR